MSEIKSLQNQLDCAAVFYSTIRGIVVGVSNKAKSGNFSKEELCDIGFLCRELITQFEEIRKDIQAVKVLVDKIACITVMKETLSNPTDNDTIHGELSSGTPHYRKTVTLPKKDTKEYYNMMKYFGVTDKGIEEGVVKISWNRISKYTTELVELGKPVPEFLPVIHDDYTIIHRRKQRTE